MQNFPVRLTALWRQVFPGLMAGAVASRGWSWLDGAAFSWPQSLPLMLLAAVLMVACHLLLPTQDLSGLHALTLSRGGPAHPLTLALEMPMSRL